MQPQRYQTTKVTQIPFCVLRAVVPLWFPLHRRPLSCKILLQIAIFVAILLTSVGEVCSFAAGICVFAGSRRFTNSDG